MDKASVRKGMPDAKLEKDEFARRLRAHFYDPAFSHAVPEIETIIAIAWDAYENSRKAPRTRKAGPGYADPDYNLSIEWIEASERIRAAQHNYENKSRPPRILIVNGSTRSEHTCPGEMSKTYRLTRIAQEVIMAEPDFESDLLDLSRLASEYGRVIYPCKSCVSTAMPLCHWPCSCYPNHALNQSGDWMNEIYPQWVAADGVMIVTPVHWYQAPSSLKLMIDRLVCADGGNPDPTSTHGKRPEEAKALELKGWPYPRHLAGRVFSVVVHGDATGTENLRRMLSDWLSDMGLIPSGSLGSIDRYVGYLAPYATSHDALDRDADFQDDVRSAARALVQAVKDRRSGKLQPPDRGLHEARPK
jgi:multimeric flavodoxin WrbA